jgi:hypothetical protein
MAFHAREEIVDVTFGLLGNVTEKRTVLTSPNLESVMA